MPRPLQRPQIVDMNADISENIKDKELGSQIRFRSLVRSARLLREYATPLLRPQTAKTCDA